MLDLVVGHVDSVVEITAPKNVVVVDDVLATTDIGWKLNLLHDFVVIFVTL